MVNRSFSTGNTAIAKSTSPERISSPINFDPVSTSSSVMLGYFSRNFLAISGKNSVPIKGGMPNLIFPDFTFLTS